MIQVIIQLNDNFFVTSTDGRVAKSKSSERQYQKLDLKNTTSILPE